MGTGDNPQTSATHELITTLLTEIPMFNSLRTAELDVLAGYTNFMDLKPGEFLFREGEKGDYGCFVAKGSLDVIKKSGDEGSSKIANLKAGRSIGEMSLIDSFPRSASAKAVEDTTVIILTAQVFDQLLRDHPKIGVKILKGVARLLSLNLRRTSGMLVDHLQHGK